MPLPPSIALACLLAVVSAWAPAWNEAQAQNDFTVITEGGKHLAITSEISPPQINRMHSWRLRLTDADGAPLSNASIEVRGGMPDHDHGLPTRPEVTGEVEPGVYLLQGLRFHMPGRWLLEFIIALDGEEGGNEDGASLELNL